MSQQQFKNIYTKTIEWVLEAGQELRETLYDKLEVEYKTSVADLVTEKDRETEQFFVKKIKEHYPHHYILGEEGMASQDEFDPQREVVWVIDPIDGTTNFVHQKRNFAISVGIYEQGEPRIGVIYDPMSGECFRALRGEGAFLNKEQLEPSQGGTVEEAVLGINGMWLVPNRRYDHQKIHPVVQHVRGTRSIGAAALEMAYVACGRLDGYLTLRLHPWDFAAGLVILSELGATATTIKGETIDVFEKTSVFVARPELHREVFEKFFAEKE